MRDFLIFLIALGCSTTVLFGVNKYNKKVSQVEDLIFEGNLKKAEKSILKLIKKGDKQLGKENYAKLALYKGQVLAYKQASISVFLPELIKGAELYQKASTQGVVYSDLVLAKSYFSAGYFQKALDVFGKEIQVDDWDSFVTERVFLLLKNYIAKGEYELARELIKGVKSKFKPDDLVKIKNLEVLLNIKRGDYLLAEQLLLDAEKLLFDVCGRNSFEAIDFYYLHGKLFFEMNDHPNAIKYFEKAYNLARGKGYPLFYSEFVTTKGELSEDFTYVLELHHKDSYGFDVAKEYLSILKKSTGSGVFYNQMRTYHLLNFDMLQERYDQVILKVQNLEKNSPELFRNLNFKLLLDKLVLDCYYNKLQFFDAEKYTKELIPLYKEVYGKESLYLSQLRLDLGRLYAREMGLLDKAMAVFSSDDYQKVNRELAFSCQSLIYYNEVFSDIKLAQEKFEEARSVLEPQVQFLTDYYNGKENEVLARVYVHFSKILIALGEYKEANVYLEAGREIYDRIYHDIVDYEYMLKVTGSFYMELSYYEEAIELLEEAERISKEFGDDLTIDELSEFAVLYIKTGRFKGIEELLLEIIAEKKQLKQSQSSIVPDYNKLAELYLIQGKYSEVEECLHAVNQLVDQEFKKTLKYAETQNLEGKFYMLIGDFEKANSLFKKVREKQEKLLPAGHPKIAYTIQEECISRLAIGDEIGVEEDLQEASRIISDAVGEDSRAYAESLKKLGVYYTQVREYPKAEKVLEEAYKILEMYGKKVKKNESLAETCLYLGNVKKERNDEKEATSYFKKSLLAYKKIFGNQHPKYLHVIGELAQLEAIKGQELKALELLEKSTSGYLNYINEYFPTLTEREKSKFWAMMKTDFEYFNALALRNYENTPRLAGEIYNDLLVTKSLLLNSSIQIRKKITQSGDPEVLEKFDEWLLKKTELMLVLNKSKEDLELEGINKEELLQEVTQLERFLGKKIEYLHFKSETWQDIQKGLKSNEVAIEIVRYVEVVGEQKGMVKYAALIIKNEKTYKYPEVVLIAEGDKMEGKYFSHYRNSLLYLIEDNLSFDRYWKPIDDKLEQGDKVYLSPDGVYMLMNIEVLKTQRGQAVLDQNQIVLVGNTKDVTTERQKLKKTNSALLLGDPSFYPNNQTGRVSQLPGTGEEIDLLNQLLIEKNWRVLPYTQNEAGEDKLIVDDAYQLIHIATHGFFSQKEEHSEELTELGVEYNNTLFQSGLILADGGALYESQDKMHEEQGVLTSYEALNLKLDQVDLVVLSACETGVGEVQNGEGVFGLQRSFLIAGAKNVIMSLYKVSDEVTAELMASFYSHWLKGKSKHEALIAAKKEIRIKHPNAYYWGGFVIIGIDE